MEARRWRLSEYTQVTAGQDGSLILHNSFMGALAKIPPELAGDVQPYVQPAFAKWRIPAQETYPQATMDGHAVLRELCMGGFFVPQELDERRRVEEVLHKERTYGFHIIALPHEDCNFRCVYCYESFLRGQMKPEVVEGLKKLVEKKAGEVNALTVGWFGGEPCLARDIIYDLSESFMASCERNGIPYRSNMTTNGYFLSEDVVTRLLACKVGHFQVTVDGSQHDHDNVRKLRGGQGTYHKIFANLIAMSHRDDDFSVAIRVNFTPQTVAGIEEFLLDAQAHFAHDERFFLDFHAVGRWGGPNDSTMAVVEEQNAQQTRLGLMRKSTCKGFGVTALRNVLQPHGSTCYAGKESSVVVGSDGRLYKCTVAFEDERNHVGWLRPDGSLDVEQHKWDMWTKPHSTSGKCGTCSFSASCQSRACPLAAIEAQEPPCPYTPEEFSGLLQFAASAENGAEAPSSGRMAAVDKHREAG